MPYNIICLAIINRDRLKKSKARNKSLPSFFMFSSLWNKHFFNTGLIFTSKGFYVKKYGGKRGWGLVAVHFDIPKLNGFAKMYYTQRGPLKRVFLNNKHCIKSVQIRSYFWSLFSCIQSEITRNNSIFGHFSHSEKGPTLTFGFSDIISCGILMIPCRSATFGPGNVSNLERQYNTIKRCEIFSKLTIKRPEWRHWRSSGVFIDDFEHTSHLFLVFLLLNLNK